MSPHSAAPCRSFGPTFLLLGFFCTFVLVGIFHHSESHSTLSLHTRRSENFLIHREDNLTSTSATPSTDAITTRATPSSNPPSSSISTSSQLSSSLSSFGSVSSRPQSSSGHSSSSPSASSSTTQTSPSSSSAQSSTPSSPTALRLTFSNIPTSTQSSSPSVATTLALTDLSSPIAVTSIIATTSSFTDTGPTNVASAVSSSSSTFWKKKGAVAATFTIIAFVLVATSAILIVTFLKKRNAKQQRRLHEELFEKYSEDGHRSNSPGPSINAAPLDAFARRDVRHDSGVPFGGYPVTPIQRTAPSTSPVQHPDYYSQPPPARYVLPSQSQASARKPAPTAFREPMGRQQARDSYQPSIDSFYGAAGQPTS